MDTNPEFELAQLSLTGRRYNEAEEKFTRLLSTPDAPQAWLGLGLAKIGKLPSRKATPDEVAYCFNKVFALTPDRKDEACQLVLSAAKAMLEEVESKLPQVAAAEAAANRLRGSAFLHKGLSYLRASATSSGSRPTLFTNLDALHDSYRGSVLLDASSELNTSAQQMRSYLAEAVANIRGAVLQVVPDDFQFKKECLAAADDLVQRLSFSTEELREQSLAPATSDLYLSRYRSSDQKTYYGICGGLAHRWGWKHLNVQLLFVFLTPFYFVGPIWYAVELSRTNVSLPTKGIRRRHPQN